MHVELADLGCRCGLRCMVSAYPHSLWATLWITFFWKGQPTDHWSVIAFMVRNCSGQARAQTILVPDDRCFTDGVQNTFSLISRIVFSFPRVALTLGVSDENMKAGQGGQVRFRA